VLFDLDHDLAGSSRGPRHAIENLVTGVRLVPRHAWISATNLDPRARLHIHADPVVQSQRLINRAQFVEPVGPARTDLQPEIDLRERGE